MPRKLLTGEEARLAKLLQGSAAVETRQAEGAYAEADRSGCPGAVGMFLWVVFLCFFVVFGLFLVEFFPNSHAMGSCKTNRRTGPVGSPSDLVDGYVVMVSRSCCDGVPVML